MQSIIFVECVYYGVAVGNYLGWLLSEVLGSLLLLTASRSTGQRHRGRGFPGGIGVFSWLPIPALLGALLFAYLLRRRCRLSLATSRTGGYKLRAG